MYLIGLNFLYSHKKVYCSGLENAEGVDNSKAFTDSATEKAIDTVPDNTADVAPSVKTERLKIGDTELVLVSHAKAERILYGAIGVLIGFNLICFPFILPKFRMFLGAPFLPTRKKTVDALFDRLLKGYGGVVKGGHNSGSSSSSSSGVSGTASSLSIHPEQPSGLAGKKMADETANMANVTETKIPKLTPTRLLDIGSGDGRIVIAAAKRGYDSTGVEINPYLFFLSRFNRFRFLNRQERKLCSFRLGNIWNVMKDNRHNKQEGNFFSNYDVITFYGRPGDEVMKKIGAAIELGAKKNTLVVSNQFDVPGWERKLVKLHDDLRLYDLK